MDVKGILNILNLKLDNNQKYIVVSLILCGLLCSYVSPVIIKDIYTKLPSEWIAFESLVGSISGFLLSIFWRGVIRKQAIKKFLLLVISETICGILVCGYLLLIDYNIWLLAIAQLIYTTFITSFVCKCIMVFKSKLWNNKDREIYDNNIEIVACLTSILGYLTAIIVEPNIYLAIFLWGIAYLVDDIGWAIVYFKNRELLSKEDDSNS